MERKSAGWKQKAAMLLSSCVLVAVLLGLGEAYCRSFTRINFLDNSRGLFTYRRFGESYGNTPNFTGISFGETFYTDGEGFRIDPEFKPTAAPDAPALLIMGDSVSFGTALKDDVTIAGLLRRAMPQTNIYNGSVIGYDSFDYKTVTLAHIARHPEVKTVALFVCLNDISDASAQLIRSQKGQTSEADIQIANPSIPRRVNDFLRSRSKLYLWLKNLLVDTQMYYFQYDLGGYKKGEENVSSALQPIVELDKELKAKGVALRVFISPYEAQLRTPPPEDSTLPQKLITQVLTKNGVENYDLAPDFLKAAPNTKQLFLFGDPMHFSVEGARVAASAACARLENCKIDQ